MSRRPAALLLFSLVAAAAGCSRAPEAGRIEGRVLWEGRGIESALVGAYAKKDLDPSTGPVAQAASDPDGHFRIDLPAGRYWVWARANLKAGGRGSRVVGQAAGNPVDVPAGGAVQAEVLLKDPSGLSPASGETGAGVVGLVAGQGSSRTGKILVAAYPGRSERPVGPGFSAVRPAASDGRFRLDLPPGRYTVAARWRAQGGDSGDLGVGDRVATVVVDVAAGRYTDAGRLDLHPVDPSVLRNSPKGSPPTSTAVSGRVADDGGKPLQGVRVLAFKDPRMAGKPIALSASTGPDGSFVVYLPGGGKYFFGARSRLGGPAEPGEKVGSYRGDDGTGVSVRDGEVRSGVELTAEEVW